MLLINVSGCWDVSRCLWSQEHGPLDKLMWHCLCWLSMTLSRRLHSDLLSYSMLFFLHISLSLSLSLYLSLPPFPGCLLLLLCAIWSFTGTPLKRFTRWISLLLSLSLARSLFCALSLRSLSLSWWLSHLTDWLMCQRWLGYATAKWEEGVRDKCFQKLSDAPGPKFCFCFVSLRVRHVQCDML